MRKIFYDRIIRADERGVFLFAVTVFGVTAESDILSRRPLVNFFKVFVGNVFKRFAYGYTVPGVVVTLYEFPQRETFAEIFVFDNRVRSHYRRTDAISVHRFAERRIDVACDYIVKSLYPFPYAGIEDGVFHVRAVAAFSVFDYKFYSALTVAVGKVVFKFERLGLFVDAFRLSHVIAAADEHIQSVYERVEKLIFIRHERIFAEDVKHLHRRDFAVVVHADHVRMSAEMSYRPARNFLCKFYRQNLFGFGDIVPRITDKRVDRIKTVFYSLNPYFVDRPQHVFFRQSDRTFALAYSRKSVRPDVFGRQKVIDLFKRLVVIVYAGGIDAIFVMIFGLYFADFGCGLNVFTDYPYKSPRDEVVERIVFEMFGKNGKLFVGSLF